VVELHLEQPHKFELQSPIFLSREEMCQLCLQASINKGYKKECGYELQLLW